MEYFNGNPATLWFVLGFMLIDLEDEIPGLPTEVLLFTGVGALLIGVAIFIGWISQTWMTGIAWSVLSALLTAPGHGADL